MMKKIIYSLIGLVGLSACSSENVALDALKVYDVANTPCKLTLSQTETRPDFYWENDAVPATLGIGLGKDGIAQCVIENVEANCAAGDIHVNVTSQDRQITLVVYNDVIDVVTSCTCKYDVSFKMSQLLPGKYNLKVFYTGPDMKCKEENMAYNGEIDIVQNKMGSAIFKSKMVLPPF